MAGKSELPVLQLSVEEKECLDALIRSRSEPSSILATLDLHDGHVVARVELRHCSREFVALLEDLDACYPPTATIRIILENHAAHISKETRAYLATRLNRFNYMHTPKHGTWLNLSIRCLARWPAPTIIYEANFGHR